MGAPPRHSWRWHHVGLALVPALAVALVLWQGRRPREDPALVLEALRAQAGPRLPAAATTGAGTMTPPESYDRDRLYELVDGAAEPMLARGLERCVAASYAFADGAPAIEVAAELYRFREPAGATAQAEADRPMAARPLEGVPATFTDGQVLLAVSGRDLLKLTALTTDPRARDRLLELAAAWRKEQP